MAASLLALVLAIWGIAAPILHARTGNQGFYASARYAIAGQFVLVTAAAGALIYALVATDFSIRYVAFNTTLKTPVYYRVTGLWGALEGSLLLWEWILIIFSALVAWRYRKRMQEFMPWVLMVFAIVSAFFLAVIAFASNPFETLFPVPLDGRGLNPLLEDANMLSHPPLLYTGFVGTHGAVRLRHGGAHPRQAGPKLDRRDPALDHHRLVLFSPSATSWARGGPTTSSAGAAIGPGTRWRTPPSCPGCRPPRSCTRYRSRNGAACSRPGICS